MSQFALDIVVLKGPGILAIILIINILPILGKKTCIGTQTKNHPIHMYITIRGRFLGALYIQIA
jgi:hypothetical protein